MLHGVGFDFWQMIHHGVLRMAEWWRIFFEPRAGTDRAANGWTAFAHGAPLTTSCKPNTEASPEIPPTTTLHRATVAVIECIEA
jgi:hypothetical protein